MTDSFPAVPLPERLCALRVVMMPRDANQYGTIFGGVILSYIDQAGFIEARRHGTHRWVTVAVDSVSFHAPVHMGDVVTFHTRTIDTGTSSVRVGVAVEAACWRRNHQRPSPKGSDERPPPA